VCDSVELLYRRYVSDLLLYLSSDLLEMESKGKDVFVRSCSVVSNGDNLDGIFQAIHEIGEDHNISTDDVERIVDKVRDLSIEHAVEILSRVVEAHEGDINFPVNSWNNIKSIVDDYSENLATIPPEKALIAKMEAALIYYYSPYSEVRAVTVPTDDETVADTPRAYFVGVFWAMISTALNTFFYPRRPAISISVSVIQMLAYPSGWLLSVILPNRSFNVCGRSYTLNPGPWCTKEQMFATIIFTAADSGAYAAINNVVVHNSPVYYGSDWATFGYQLLLVLSTQFMGFGFTGMIRRIAIYSTRAMWPTVLSTIALNRTLTVRDSSEPINGWTISRYKYFFIIFLACFVYFWLPSYLFEAMHNFNWMCWIRPNNNAVNSITGLRGIGLNPLSTLDPHLITFSNPLSTPFFSQLNRYIGILIDGGIIIPLVYWLNHAYTGYLRINENIVYTNKGEEYDVKRVLKDGDILDKSKYQKYSPPFYSAGTLATYGAYFVLYPFSVIETILYNYKLVKIEFIDVWNGIKGQKRANRIDQDDPHSRMMLKYLEVPDWWFLIILAVSLTLMVLCVEIYPTNTPVWSILLVMALSAIFLIPISILYSTTGFSFDLGVLVEIIIGYTVPGSSVALMISKALGHNITTQALNYASAQKMGHYSKIPPMAVFKGQLIATLFQVFISLGIVNWQISNVEGLCTPNQPSRFTCPNSNTFFSSSIAWGLIGPDVILDHLYPLLKYSFLLGTLLPFPLYFLRNHYKRSLKHFQPTLILGGFLCFAPTSAVHYTEGLYLGFIFMYYIRRRYLNWWEKYNYVTATAISAAFSFSATIIFFSVQYIRQPLNWWGNTVFTRTIDGGGFGPEGFRRLPLPQKGHFGPDPGNYPI
jgi:OPT family small oligopeptide transporter